ncbi:hypothetical protein CF70_002645 [Cupriavidus sp. SK-3]|nr:hypothetical protein CF70_002645 [Cupriavidus sp. SK-3]
MMSTYGLGAGEVIGLQLQHIDWNAGTLQMVRPKRHSNAARQLDVGTKARVLSDLLGHRDPESVSAYVRIATQSLREVSLAVPR